MSELAAQCFQKDISKLLSLLPSNLITEFIVQKHYIDAVATRPDFLIACIRVRKGHKKLEVGNVENYALAVCEDPKAFNPSRRLGSSSLIVWVYRPLKRAGRDKVGKDELAAKRHLEDEFSLLGRND